MIFKNNKSLKMFCCFILLAGMLASNLPVVYGVNGDQDIRTKYQLRRYTDDSKPLKQMYYRLYIPDDYNESIAYPLVIFFGGAGQNVGVQIDGNVGSTKFIDSSLLENGNDQKYPCIILMPLLQVKNFWVDNYFGKISDGMDFTMGLIDVISQKYSVDQRKIYITGMCMGANGIWDSLIRFPQKFAAGIPVAGSAPVSLASKVPDVPIWIFNSDSDPNAPVTQARAMVSALNKAGHTKVKYNEFQNYTHVETGIHAYWNEDLFIWMFSQTNPNVPFPEGKTPVGDMIENPGLKDTIPVIPQNKTEDPNDELIVDYDPYGYEDKKGYFVPEDTTNVLRRSNLPAIIILIAVTICFIIGFLIFHNRILFGKAKSYLKDGEGKE